MMAQRGSTCIVLRFLSTSALSGGWGPVFNAKTRAALPPGKASQYPLYRRLVGPQSRSGRVRKISPTEGCDSRTIQPVTSRYTDCECVVEKLSLNVKYIFM